MDKFFGKIGFVIPEETKPDVFVNKIVEHEYYGDILKNYSRVENSPNVVDSIVLKNYFSIVCDGFAYENFHSIRYLEYMGTKWKVETVENKYPRLLISVGGVYNGQN